MALLVTPAHNICYGKVTSKFLSLYLESLSRITDKYMAGPAGLRIKSGISLFGSCFARSKLLLAILYSGLPALHPSGRALHVQNCSWQFCRTHNGSSPAALNLYLTTNHVVRYSIYGWAGRIRTCACQDQNLVPYRLATAQQR